MAMTTFNMPNAHAFEFMTALRQMFPPENDGLLAKLPDIRDRLVAKFALESNAPPSSEHKSMSFLIEREDAVQLARFCHMVGNFCAGQTDTLDFMGRKILEDVGATVTGFLIGVSPDGVEPVWDGRGDLPYYLLLNRVAQSGMPPESEYSRSLRHDDLLRVFVTPEVWQTNIAALTTLSRANSRITLRVRANPHLIALEALALLENAEQERTE